ncbi:DUF4249 domain-containing protein [Fulvivirgaceae bacterium BMA12]|uniref:DUF4249 domain-containing protein n=1 Tax=Agaribacillus aureus TaxID=3051825 RepID=A0ABT8LG82_9BACT|nr:DUF4249 domain-containing protein [Fulvivirgaceae bacterium BMA12]
MNRLLLLILLIISAACETPFDPKVSPDTKVVVNSFFHPGNPLKVNLTSSNYILEPEQINPINQAIVKISNDEGTHELLLEDGKGNYASSLIPEVGKEYFLSVQVPGFPEATSVDVIPASVPVQSFTVSTQIASVNLDGFGYPAKLTFTDPGAVENYYGIEVVILRPGAGDLLNGKQGFLITEDPDVGLTGNVDIQIGDSSSVEADPILFFNDIRFNGKPHTLNFFIAPINVNLSSPIGYEIHVVLKSLSKDYYDYLQTSAFQKRIEDENTFAAPVQVANNIQNGLGIFAGFSFHTLEADLLE